MSASGNNSISFFSWFKLLEEANLILSFKGDFNRDLISSILFIASGKSQLKENEEVIKKRIFGVMVECLQNICKHGANDAANGQLKPGIILIAKKDNNVIVSTGNLLLNSEVEPLKRQLEKLKKLTKQEIKSLAKNVLMTTELSAKSGAGLGLISIARKSNEINFDTRKINEHLSFFALEVTISSNVS